MKMPDIKKKAAGLGIKAPRTMTKTELIRLIQKTEGNTPCFSTGLSNCPYTECCFRDDCLN